METKTKQANKHNTITITTKNNNMGIISAKGITF
jgi:hypothetical protein